MIYRFTVVREPDQSLLTLLPDAPVGYVSVKDLGGLIETFARSEFGKQTMQMPILAEPWWQQIVYQKRLWESEMGGKLDLQMLKGYFGREAILSFYHRGNALSFLLTSIVGEKEKLEIAALTATDAVNTDYQRLKEKYRGITINTIMGYPRDFSYAFIGPISVLTIDKSLLKDTIDIYKKKKPGFIDLHPMGYDLRQEYNAARNTIYVDFPKLTPVYPHLPSNPPNLGGRGVRGQGGVDERLKPLVDGVNVWTFSNRYERGVIHSRHRLTGNASWQLALQQQLSVPTPLRPHPQPLSETERGESGGRETSNPGPINVHLSSILPASTAILGVSNHASPAALWKGLDANLPIQRQGSPIDLSRYLKSELGLALLASPSDSPMAMPSLLLIFPIAERAGLEAELMKLKQETFLINGKPMKFLAPQDYQGTELQPVQIPIGFIFSLTGGYAIVDNDWVVSTTISGLKSTIDALGGRETALAGVPFPVPLDQPSSIYIAIQPNRLVPELKRLLPMGGLIATALGQKINPQLITRIMNNLFPLESLGPITADIDFDGGGVNGEIQIVLEK
jgi:hypothetical protein